MPEPLHYTRHRSPPDVVRGRFPFEGDTEDRNLRTGPESIDVAREAGNFPAYFRRKKLVEFPCDAGDLWVDPIGFKTFAQNMGILGQAGSTDRPRLRQPGSRVA